MKTERKNELFIIFQGIISYSARVDKCGYLVFIIYQKPYVAISNAARGAARFETVGQVLGLESRVFQNASDAEKSLSIYDPIPYDTVMKRMQAENKRAIEWLIDALDYPEKRNIETPNTVHAACERKTTVLYQQIAELTNRIRRLETENAEQRKAYSKITAQSEGISCQAGEAGADVPGISGIA